MTRRVDDADARPGGDYEVGYAKPPKATRFQPGRSGNPLGRRKGARSPVNMLKAEIERMVEITIDGKTKKVSALEVILRQATNKAAKGAGKELRDWMKVLGVGGGDTEPDEAERAAEMETLEAFRERMKRSRS